MDAGGWEYRVAVFKNPDVWTLEPWLNDFGVAGWEVVTLSTTVKTWLNLTGNDLVVVMKRPSGKPMDREHITGVEPPPTRQGFYPDPLKRHQFRWWTGDEWTERVRDGSEEADDPL